MTQQLYRAFGEEYLMVSGENCRFPYAKRHLDSARKKYGEYVKVEFGPGRIAEKDKRDYVTIGLNESADPYCDIYVNLELGIPLPDDSVDEIYSNQFLEHIARDKFIEFMNEMYRVLKQGGKMIHCVPHYLSPWAIGDPTHVNLFSEQSFMYFSVRPDGSPFVEKFSDYGIIAKFLVKQSVKSNMGNPIDITVEMVKV